MDKSLLNNYQYIVSYLSPRIQMYLLKLSDDLIEKIYEIRIRAERPIMLVTSQGSAFLTNTGKISYIWSSNSVVVYKNEIEDTVNKMCGYSMHSHYEDILNGYITLPNGSRVGLCGTAIFDKDKIKGVKDISYLNIRIPRNINGISDIIFDNILKNGLDNIIIAGPPTSGKTTLLKDIEYQISSGRLGKYYKICVVDERKEICPDKRNVKSLGPNTDVLLGYPKAKGISIATRVLSPDLIICDEIGFNDEIDEIINGMNSGINFIISIHAKSFDELKHKKIYKKIINDTEINNLVLLSGKDSPGRVSKIIKIGDNCEENLHNNNFNNFACNC